MSWPLALAQAQAAVSPSSTVAAGNSALLDAATRKEVVEALAKSLAENYARADAGEKMAQALRGRLKAKAYNKITSGEELAQALQADIRAINDDKHLRVGFSAQPMSGTRPPAMDVQNGGIRKLQILPGNIGYMQVNLLPPDAADTIAAAFAFVHGTDALILDLRGNGGGSPQACAQFMSYLSEGAPYVVNTIHWRKGDRVDEFKTTDMGARSYGTKKPVFVLTGSRTFSGGEELAYDIQAFKRGQVVGETTGGGANPGGMRMLGHGFSVFLPAGYAVHPATGTNWEGIGVKPDIAVTADQALVTGQRLAAERLKANTTDPATRAMLDALVLQLERPASSGIEILPNHLSVERLVGRYSSSVDFGPTANPSIVQKDGKLFVQEFPNSSKQYPLLPLGGDRYRMQGFPDNFTAAFSERGGKIQLTLESTMMPLVVVEKH